MSASEDLDSLDNKTLRAKCLEYGLPNVPITDTSRKILIKKLRLAMDGGSTVPTKGLKGRRETMHVTSTTNNKNEEPKEEIKTSGRASNRRTTISALRKEKEPTPQKETIILSAADKRRTSRTTPIQETAIPISLPRKTIPVVIEETDFDEEFILIDDDDMQQPIVTNIPILRKSRSPSLTKSAVVTTSYNKDFLKKNQQILEEDEIEELTHSIIPRFTATANVLKSVEPQHDIYPTGYTSIYPTLNVGDNLSSVKTSYESSATKTRRTYTPTGDLNFPSSSSSLKQPTNIDSIRHRSIHKPHIIENSDSNPEEDDDIVQQAPYLSDFARRLSSLKAEKLDSGIKKDLFATGDGYSKNYGRRAYNKPENGGGVGESIHQLWIVLDRKYKIKRFIFVVTLLTALILLFYYYYLQN